MVVAPLISKPGLTSASVLSIPTNWSASWFRSLIASTLIGGDVRNAVGTGGIVVSGNLTSPYATIGFGSPVALPGPVTITYTGSGSALTISTNSSTPDAITLHRSDLGTGDDISIWNNAGTFQFTAPISVHGTAGNAVVTASNGIVTGQLFIGGAGNFQVGASSNHPLLLFADNGGGTITLSTAGVVTFGQYGAGTLSTNASGVITASDGRYKVKTRPIENALDAISRLQPTYYRWREDTPFHTEYEEIGFFAQEVSAVIPEASPEPERSDRFKNYHDRAILALLVKAVQELKVRYEQ
jgi:hypothetical protein